MLARQGVIVRVAFDDVSDERFLHLCHVEARILLQPLTALFLTCDEHTVVSSAHRGTFL